MIRKSHRLYWKRYAKETGGKGNCRAARNVDLIDPISPIRPNAGLVQNSKTEDFSVVELEKSNAESVCGLPFRLHRGCPERMCKLKNEEPSLSAFSTRFSTGRHLHFWRLGDWMCKQKESIESIESMIDGEFWVLKLVKRVMTSRNVFLL